MEAVHTSYTFRTHQPGDVNFIMDSWGSSFYKSYEGFSYVVPPASFHEHHRPIREAFLKGENSAAVIACSKEDPDLIIGYVLFEKAPKASILQYVYVKEAFKGLGIGLELIGLIPQDKIILFTHLTDKGRKIMRKKPELFSNFKYTPHLIKAGVHK